MYVYVCEHIYIYMNIMYMLLRAELRCAVRIVPLAMCRPASRTTPPFIELEVVADGTPHRADLHPHFHWVFVEGQCKGRAISKA